MRRFNIQNLEPGLLICGRNNKTLEAKAIRWGVHSFTNHNAMVVAHDGKWGIAEAVTPVSKISTLHHYEKLMNEDGYLVRVYRHKTLTDGERKLAAKYFCLKFLGLKYPRKRRMVLLALPLYNAIVDRAKIVPPIRLTWCSQLVKEAYTFANGNALDGLDGKKKKLFTPKTFENRIMLGLFEDVTDSVVATEKP